MTKVQQLIPSKEINKTGQIPMEIHMHYKPGGQKLTIRNLIYDIVVFENVTPSCFLGGNQSISKVEYSRFHRKIDTYQPE
jgi:hypothetical protein